MECSSDITKGPFKGLSEYKDDFGTYFKVFGVIILHGRFLGWTWRKNSCYEVAFFRSLQNF